MLCSEPSREPPPRPLRSAASRPHSGIHRKGGESTTTRAHAQGQTTLLKSNRSSAISVHHSDRRDSSAPCEVPPNPRQVNVPDSRQSWVVPWERLLGYSSWSLFHCDLERTDRSGNVLHYSSIESCLRMRQARTYSYTELSWSRRRRRESSNGGPPERV